MRIAIISDIHANIEALKAVLEDLQQQDVQKIFCTGDLVGYAPYPNEVIALIREKKIPTVMGNYDDAVGNMRFVCGCDYKDAQAQALGELSIAWTKANTAEDNKEYLRNLPHRLHLEIAGRKLLLVHGSPNELNEYIYEDFPEENLGAFFEKSGADIIICGHTHKPFTRPCKGKLLVNAGSVGKPKHGTPEATYVIIVMEEEVEVGIRKVSYDYEKVAQAIEQSGLPDEFAGLLRSGRS